MRIDTALGSLLLLLAAVSKGTVCQTTSTTPITSSSRSAVTTTRRPYRRPTRRPFNQETALRRHVIQNARLQSPNVPPTPIFSNITRVTLKLIANGISRIDGTPHQMYLHGLLCMSWHNIALVWGETAYKNVDKIPVYFWEIWTPRLIYYYRKGLLRKFSSSRKWVTVKSDGMCEWCYPVRLVLNCEELNFRSNECKAYLRLFGYPDTQIKFKVSAVATQRLELPDLKIKTINFQNTYNSSTAPSMISDEVTVVLTTAEGHPLDFITVTWPMMCIVITTLLAGGICATRSSKFDNICTGNNRCGFTDRRTIFTSSLYNMFSLRVWVGVLTGVVCCLSLGDHRLHPRLANAPYLSWLLALLGTLGIIALTEELYETNRSHFGSGHLSSTDATSSSRTHIYWQCLRIAVVVTALGVVLLI